MTAATKTAGSPKTAAATKDAITMLKADHDAVSALFAQYEKTNSSAKKKSSSTRSAPH